MIGLHTIYSLKQWLILRKWKSQAWRTKEGDANHPCYDTVTLNINSDPPLLFQHSVDNISNDPQR